MHRDAKISTSKMKVQTWALPWAQAPALNMSSVYEKASIGDTLPQAYDSFTPKNAIKRRAGIILHPTSLPGPYGVGELGGEARLFVDWLVTAGDCVFTMSM
ncbi:hypothetical protein CEUSTIGMA_g3133.t1 [Chlamydomonas eustigma]|uniref:4-alpha-glucanotransferase n=1 Tax=Chlamydomonas eustigma TaxID=1157962 RepID=A0A250WYV7_9CHLO|nr:hypothetical protein CEUSTIGMA_g3133.t1 [Chlamydomonas eustigma]|eukprot:GAX75690.1 hypothetical protein CEUSTIGMA_g3133.t1 [Chlamydomonas eustigma]